MKIVFIVNNKNNRLAKVLPGIRQYCEENLPGRVEFSSTLRKKHAIDLAKQATEKGCDYLIAIGGDGTLHELTNGVLQSNVAPATYPAIGLLPYGSANDFARTIGVSNSIKALIAMIESHSIQNISLGKIVLQKTGEIRYFINIAGLGLGPEVVQKLEQSSSVLGPSFNYFKQIIKGFLSYSNKEVSCKGDGWQWKGKLLQMAVANGQYFGNAICIAPDARLTNDTFFVAIFGNLSIWDYLKNLKKLKKGVKIIHPEVSYQKAGEVLIESKDPCGIEADGEYVGLTPAVITLLPKSIPFLMPAIVQ